MVELDSDCTPCTCDRGDVSKVWADGRPITLSSSNWNSDLTVISYTKYGNFELKYTEMHLAASGLRPDPPGKLDCSQTP